MLLLTVGAVAWARSSRSAEVTHGRVLRPARPPRAERAAAGAVRVWAARSSGLSTARDVAGRSCCTGSACRPLVFGGAAVPVPARDERRHARRLRVRGRAGHRADADHRLRADPGHRAGRCADRGAGLAVTGLNIGYGLGSSVVGGIADAHGARTAFLVAVFAGLFTGAVALVLRRRLRAPDRPRSHPGGTIGACRSTVTRRSSSGCTSSVRPTGSSRCSPAATAGSAPSARACGAPRRSSARGSNPAATSTSSSTRGWLPDSARPAAHRGLDIVQQTDSIGAYGAQLADDYSALDGRVGDLRDRRAADRGGRAVAAAVPARGRRARALVAREHDPGLVLDAFFIRAASLSGWEPALHECAKCSAPGPHAAFNVAAGGAVCARCRPPGSARPHPRPSP